ncbi:MAG: hypothetical protein ACK40D_03890 [Cyanobacteriota bacterium]|jgi:hypothetical protein
MAPAQWLSFWRQLGRSWLPFLGRASSPSLSIVGDDIAQVVVERQQMQPRDGPALLHARPRST